MRSGMKRLKDILKLNDSKTFQSAVSFYLLHMVMSFVLTFLVVAVWILGFSQEPLSEEQIGTAATVLQVLYVVLLAVLLLRAKGRALAYVNLALLGILTTYVLHISIGLLCIAYATTLGGTGKKVTLL